MAIKATWVEWCLSKRFVAVMWLGVCCMLDTSAQLTGDAEFNTFQSNIVLLAQAVTNDQPAAAQTLLSDMALLNQSISPRLERLGQRVDAMLTRLTIPDGFTYEDYFEAPAIAVNANYYRSRALYLTSLWLSTSNTSIASNLLETISISQTEDTRLAKLFSVMVNGPLTNQVPPFLMVTVESDDVIPAEEQSVVTIRVENVGDSTAEDVEVRYSTNARLAPAGEQAVGSIPPNQWVDVDLFMPPQLEDIVILMDVEVVSSNARKVGFTDMMSAYTNCAAGP